MNKRDPEPRNVEPLHARGDAVTGRDVARAIKGYLMAYLLTGLAIGTFVGACVVAWGRR